MKTNPTISNSKIIVFIVFICCALMTSLFVYHAKHKQTLTVLADGNATLFPVARDIKPFELVSIDHSKLTQNNFLHHWTILFFGFTHCSSICPNTLNTLAHAYDKLSKTHPDLQVIFISLDPERDTLARLIHFTQSFNPAFIGASGKIQEVRKLQSQLGIFSERDQLSNDNYQIQHSPSILLINPQGKWVGIFKYGMNADQFIAAFKETMQHV